MPSSKAHIKQTQKRQFSFVTLFLRKWSVVVAYYLNKVGITPHQVLFFRVIFFGWGSLPLFYSENYIYNLIGLFLITLCYFFDLVDGDLARNHDQVTPLWGFLDGNFDAIVLNSIILTFTLKFYNHWYESLYVMAWTIILYGTIFSSKMTELFQNHFKIGCGQWSDIIENFLRDHTFDRRSVFFYRLITPKGFPFSLLSNFRDYLLVGILFHAMPYAILGFAIAINIRWILLFIMVACYYRWISTDTGRIELFRLMKQSEK
jgi:phosphatidylglycerophosphate synthase